MSCRIMLKKCQGCGKRFSYNPSVGKFGLVCPHCGRVQGIMKGEDDEGA